MSDYDFDTSFKIYSPQPYHWQTRDDGTQMLELMPKYFFKAIGFGGSVAGLGWLAFGIFVPFFTPLPPRLQPLLLCGGVAFIFFGFIAGWLFDRYMASRGPLLILHPNGDIEMPQHKRTVTPEAATHFELLPTPQHNRRQQKGLFDLVLYHKEQTYYITSGLQSLFAQGKKTPLEQWYENLMELYPLEEKQLSDQERKTVAQRKRNMEQNISQERVSSQRFVAFIMFVIGTSFTAAGFGVFASTPKEQLVARIVAGSFAGIGLIVLAVFSYVFIRSFHDTGDNPDGFR